MRQANEFHLNGLREEGEPVPVPVTSAAFVDVARLAVTRFGASVRALRV